MVLGRVMVCLNKWGMKMEKDDETSQDLEDFSVDNSEEHKSAIRVARIIFFISLAGFLYYLQYLSFFFVIPTGPWMVVLGLLLVMIVSFFVSILPILKVILGRARSRR